MRYMHQPKDVVPMEAAATIGILRGNGERLI
jgi:hypothetical protein